MTFQPTMSVLDLQTAAREIVDNGVVLEPKMDAPVLADRLIEEAEPTFRAEFGRVLMVKEFTRMIRANRAKRRTLERPKGFEKLPIRIQIYAKDGKRRFVRLDRVTATDMVQFCKIREGKHKSHKQTDEVLKQARALRDRLRKRSKKSKGITAGEVLSFDFGH